MNPKISVIVPVYNVEKYLRRCIDSILSQTFSDFELLLIDDGSKDKSGDICDEYVAKDVRIKVFHKANAGVSSARNLGLDKAKGEFIFFVDSDDFLDKTHLENYSKDIDNFDLIFQGYKLVEETTGKVMEKKTFHEIETVDFESSMYVMQQIFSLGNFFGPTWNKIFKASIISENKIRFKEDVDLREDEIFTFCYCRFVNKIKVLGSDSYNYQITPNSLMRRKWLDPLMLEKVLLYSEEITSSLNLSTSFRKEINSYLTDSWSWCLGLCYRPKHLLCYEQRLEILRYFWVAQKRSKTRSSKRQALFNIYLTDIIHLILFKLKSICRSICCRTKLF